MAQTNEAMLANREVRAVIENWVDAIRNKDIAAVVAHYDADVLTFDLLPPLQYRGREALKTRVAAWLGSFPGPIQFETRSLNIVTGNDVAYCSSLNHVRGVASNGTPIDMWWRATNCFRKFDNKWLITHGHSSEPFEMETGRALTELTP